MDESETPLLGFAVERPPAERVPDQPPSNLPVAVCEAFIVLARHFRLAPTLTTRLVEITEGLTCRRISEKNWVSSNTVKTQARLLSRALGLQCSLLRLE